jgi:hypothetical protein
MKIIQQLKSKFNDYATKNSDHVVIATIMMMLAAITSFNGVVEYTEEINLFSFIEFIFENGFYIVLYLFLDYKFKNVKINFFLKNTLIILLIALLWTLIETNLHILTNNIEATKYSQILFSTYFKELSDIGSFVVSALVIQNVINKFVINNLYRQQAGFISKIPATQRKDIYLVKSKENYIDVYYGGNAEHKLINYRFSNAVKELPIDKGTQVHRSFWVSNQILTTLKRVDGKYYVYAKGEQIPVSSTHLKKVKQIKEGL